MKDIEKMTPEEIANMVRTCNEWITGSGIVRIIDSTGKLTVSNLTVHQPVDDNPLEKVEVKKILISK